MNNSRVLLSTVCRTVLFVLLAQLIVLQPTESQVSASDLLSRKTDLAKSVLDSPVEELASLTRSPARYLVTLNCHGGKSNRKFNLHEGVYVLAPHKQGFDANFVVSIPSQLSLEDLFYDPKSVGMAPNPVNYTDGGQSGWRLYQPGETVADVDLQSWSWGESMSSEAEFQKWKERFPEDASRTLLENDGKIPVFWTVPVRRRNVSTNSVFKVDGIEKRKIKVFGKTTLSSVTKCLSDNLSKPVLLIPFSCNEAQGEANDKISISSDAGVISLSVLLQEAIRSR